MTIGNRIKIARRNKGLRQKQLAILLGVDVSTVSNYECGVRIPDIDTIGMISRYLDVSPNFLLADYYSGTDFSVDPSEVNLLRDFRLLDYFGRNAVLQLVSIEKDRVEFRKSDYITRPLFPHGFSYSKDIGPYLDNSEKVEIPIIDTTATRETDILIPMNDASMEPLFSRNEILLISRVGKVLVGDIAIFLYRDQVLIRKLGDNVLLARNREYPPIEIDGEILSLGIVIDKLVK